MTGSKTVLRELWSATGGDPSAVAEIELMGADPVLPSSFRVGTAAQASIAAVAIAAREMHRRCGGPDQSIAVDMRAAAIECRSERLALIDGRPLPELWDPVAGAYRCGDGRYIRLHTNFRHHRAGIVRLLGCADDKPGVAQALERWSAADFEQAATEVGMVVAMVRTFAEWDAHPASGPIRAAPLVRISRIADAPVRPAVARPRPLSGLRVLEATRIIAGPVAGRALAAHGADVLRVIGPGVPTIEALDIDSGRGKRSAHVDILEPGGRELFRDLARGANVVLQSYRPGVLERLGLGAANLAAAASHGVVIASLSAYGRDGAWADKRGFDSLVQTATGFNAAEAEAAGQAAPKPLPLQILDHASGYLLALGIVRTLIWQMDQGGSWHVEVSLARTGEWLRSLGRIADGLSASDPAAADVADLLETAPSGYGPLTFVRHAARMTATPPHWARPSSRYGHDEARWLP